MHVKKFIPYLLTFILGGFFSLYVFEYQKARNAENSKTNYEREGGFEYISPLLDCEYENPITERKARNIKNSLEKQVDEIQQKGQVKRISVYYRDLANGPWFGINETENFTPASLLKVPVMMAIYKEAEVNPGIVDQKVTMEEYVAQPNGGIPLPKEYQPEEKLEIGKEYSIDELIHRMISFSDNESFGLLLKTIPIETVEKVHYDLGVPYPGSSTPDNYLSAKRYASLFRVLYNASYLNNEFSSQALSIMANATYDEGIYGGLPESIKVANKYGVNQTKDPTNPIQLHDCGIVYFPGNPYILCVMTQGNDLQSLERAISEISKTVYEGMRK